MPPTHVQGPWADCDVPNKVPDQLNKLFGYPLDKVQYASEGGDKSFNGKGSVIMSKVRVFPKRSTAMLIVPIEPSVSSQLIFLAPCNFPCSVQVVEMQRNPRLTVDEIEAAAKRAFHVSHIVWVDQGVGDDDQSFRGTLPGARGSKLYTAIGDGCGALICRSEVVVGLNRLCPSNHRNWWPC